MPEQTRQMVPVLVELSVPLDKVIKTLVPLVELDDDLRIVVRTDSGSRYMIRRHEGKWLLGRKDRSEARGAVSNWYHIDPATIRFRSDGGLQLAGWETTAPKSVELFSHRQRMEIWSYPSSH